MNKSILALLLFQVIVYSSLYGQNTYSGIIINEYKPFDKIQYIISLENLKDSTKYYTSISKKDY
ncbi:MAG: hypothetical protein ACWIPI_01400, partial [Polaribacter sp.]